MRNQEPIVYPKTILIKHWEKYAHKVLNYLKERPVTIEQVFDKKIIYRRYSTRKKTKLVFIDSVEEIIEWARRHTYAFHPYICSPLQTAKCWYVLDIDPEEEVDFAITKQITKVAVEFLSQYFDKYLLKFCGKNGFHFIADLDERSQEKVFLLNKQLSLKVARHVASYILDNKTDVSIDLTSKEEKEEFTTIRSKLKAKNVIYFDTRIFHRFANIRSVYSIHPMTGLFSVPVTLETIENFKIEDAKVE